MEEVTESNSCPHCQTENPLDFKFCTECGTSLLEEIEPKLPKKVGKICPTCNQVSDYDTKYDRWWCDTCQCYLPEKELKKVVRETETRSPAVYYPPATPSIHIKERRSGLWTIAVVLIVMMILGFLFMIAVRADIGSICGGLGIIGVIISASILGKHVA